MSLRECVRRKRALLKERKLCGHGSDKMAGAHRPSHNTLFRFRGTADAHATQTRDSGVGVKCHLSKCRFDSLSHLASHRFNDSWPSRVEQFDAALLERWRGRTRGEEKAQPWRTVDNRLNLIRYLYIYIYTYYIHSIQSNNRKRRIRMYRRGFFFPPPNGWMGGSFLLRCLIVTSLPLYANAQCRTQALLNTAFELYTSSDRFVEHCSMLPEVNFQLSLVPHFFSLFLFVLWVEH